VPGVASLAVAPGLQSPQPTIRAQEKEHSMDTSGTIKVQYLPVGRNRREWMWKARDESNTITISGQRFDSLSDAVRDARTQIDGVAPDDDDDRPFVA
jgi:hypothetical protein